MKINNETFRELLLFFKDKAKYMGNSFSDRYFSSSECPRLSYRKSLPFAYKYLYRKPYIDVFHFSKKNCMNLTTEDIVMCLSFNHKKKEGHLREHRVGNCKCKQKRNLFERITGIDF